jgi:hypothetical protein
MTMQLGRFGVWLNPQYDDETRTRFVVEAEALGYGTAWLGLGRASVAGWSRSSGCWMRREPSRSRPRS